MTLFSEWALVTGTVLHIGMALLYFYVRVYIVTALGVQYL